MTYDIIINTDYCFNSNLLKQNDEREKKKKKKVCEKRILEVAGKLGYIYIHKNAKMMVSFFCFASEKFSDILSVIFCVTNIKY